jgi:hypothetical protein
MYKVQVYARTFGYARIIYLLLMTNKCIILNYIIHQIYCHTNTKKQNNQIENTHNFNLFYSPFQKHLYSRKLILKEIFNISCRAHRTQEHRKGLGYFQCVEKGYQITVKERKNGTKGQSG